MDYVVALLPSIGLGIIFVVVIRSIVHADRRERAAILEFEKNEQMSSPVAQRDNSHFRN